jgi:hypothetical protein
VRSIIKIALGVVLGLTMTVVGCAAVFSAGASKAAKDIERSDVAPTTGKAARSPRGKVPAAAAQVVVVERAFTEHGYAIVLKNTSTSAEAQGTDVVINAVDESGTVIASDNKTVNLIPAGTKFIIAGDLDIERGATVKGLQVDAKVGLSEPAADQLPKVSHVRLTRDSIGMLSVKAELTNTLNKPLSSLAGAYAVIRDADGRIVAGDYTFPDDDVAPGAKTALSFDMLSPVHGAASADVTVDNETD